MCRPSHFGITYSINPWMDPSKAADSKLATHQWELVRDTYRAFGHDVLEIEPAEGLPDMVFTANAGLVMGNRVLVSRFQHAERRREEEAYR